MFSRFVIKVEKMYSWIFVGVFLWLYRKSLLRLPEEAIIYTPNTSYIEQKDWNIDIDRRKDIKVEKINSSYLGIPKYELTYPNGVKGIMYIPNHLNQYSNDGGRLQDYPSFYNG